MSARRKYPEELRRRAVDMALSSDRSLRQVAEDLGVHREALRHWVRKAEVDRGLNKGPLTSEEREELKSLRKENGELRRANEILKSASAFFAKELDRPRTR